MFIYHCKAIVTSFNFIITLCAIMSKNYLTLLIFVFSFLQISVLAQPTFPKDEPKFNQPGIFAFTNATIHVNSIKVIENATLLIERERITEVGKGVAIPKNAVIIDLKGKHIYPSFIDLYSNYGMPEVKRGVFQAREQLETSKKGVSNWNESIHPESNSVELFKNENLASKELRNIGFGSVLTHYQDGLMRGTGLLVVLNDEKENLSVVKQKVSNNYSFRKGSSVQSYPSSLMGYISLIRQTHYDKTWYENGGSKSEFNPSLQALVENASLANIFEVNDKFNILRAQKIAAEFGLKFVYKTSGNEYQRINEIKAINSPLIIPLNFPETMDVEDYYDAQNITLAELKHWELAPSNASQLNQKGIQFCFTLDGLKEKASFMASMKKVLASGLSEADALKALTETPATIIGVQDLLGTLEKSKFANFIITNEALFTEKCIIQENWVRGKRFELREIDQLDIRGEYSLNINQLNYLLSIKGDINNPTAEVKSDTIKSTATVKKDVNTISVSFIAKDKNLSGPVRLSGTVNFDSGSWDGNGQTADGKVIIWTAIRKDKFKEEIKKKAISTDSVYVGKVYFPNMAYGFDSIPATKTYFIKNTTVWTNEADGILKNADVILKDGKILQVGKNLVKPKGAVIEIDGTGKHLTSGIIDEHTHIAISAGVNEGGQTVSAEVRIGDVVNSDDINIYRQLSGGVVAAQLLHGSANPVGGQSALIKLRWGSTPEEMKIKGADGFIKFALGENVKQSNWGNSTGRYPQSRMGVEQVYYDGFYRARAYEAEWKSYTEKLTKSKVKIDQPRRDLECETMLEILNGKRFITCHSYVQSEINMLMHVADSMGFKVNTFTHILEGYKVADKMKAHGVSASSFSDWWAYKFEVYDAIPYNASILNKVGVNVAINSDDAEMARRLNQEAGKSVKYGGMSEEDALKMVTLNPAKMLHLDKQMGSIKPGKDGDVVIWTDNPLSVYAKAEKTFVDGILYFDRDRDVELRKRNTEERLRIIKKMMEAKANGDKTIKPTRKTNKQYHCETIGEEEEEGHN
jgi:imidazolonepropionase-like amidohydrolase